MDLQIKVVSKMNDIDKLKSMVNINDVASILLNGRGKRYWCPACQSDGGNDPDLSLKGDRFKCFKCDQSGDVLDLVMLSTRRDFKEAVTWLADYAGVNAGVYAGKRSSSTLTGPSVSRRKALLKPKPAQPIAETRSPVLSAFLDSCRPVTDAPGVVEYLMDRGFSLDVVNDLGIRFCGREYQSLSGRLLNRFGQDAMVEAGLLAQGKKGYYPTFWPITGRRSGFLVFPYLLKGRPVYLKVRPPVEKERAAALDLKRWMNTVGTIPCLYNVDVLEKADRVLICEGETDVIAALSEGHSAVGAPGANSAGRFSLEWCRLFLNKKSFLVFDADKAGIRGAGDIIEAFEQAGVPAPIRLKLPTGLDLNSYLQEG